MARRDFSKVTPDSVPAPRAADTRTAGARPAAKPGGVAGILADRRARWVVGAVAVVGVVVIVFRLLTGGTGSEPEGKAVQAPHGPASISEGVPSGYTRDKSGAATAAVNFIQAMGQAYAGKLDVAKIRAKSVVPQPGPKLGEALSSNENRAEGKDVFSDVPLSIKVTSLTPDAATVSVWTATAGTSAINASGQLATTVVWSTTDVQLVWSEGDWKAKDWSFRQGPDPATAAAPVKGDAAQKIESGYYSFYVN